jgi:hypothetical protein
LGVHPVIGWKVFRLLKKSVQRIIVMIIGDANPRPKMGRPASVGIHRLLKNILKDHKIILMLV